MTTAEEKNEDRLHRLILDAHAQGESWQLAELYKQASELKRMDDDNEAAGFLLTQAYVFALESGHPSATDIRMSLAKDGRELSE